MSCSALIRSAPWICTRWRRERLAETLAPVGPQGPPARRCARLVAVAPRARGSLLWTTGTSCVSANLSTMSPNTCPPSPQPLQAGGEGAERQRREAGECSPALPLPNKPSIAVLPFANMSGDPEQEYFADGMVEEIITALSRIRWLFVIARNSTFTYKGQAVDVSGSAASSASAMSWKARCARRAVECALPRS